MDTKNLTMKISRIILLIVPLLLSFLFVFSQKNNGYPAWEHPVIKAFDKKEPHLIAFSHDKDDDYFIPLAILNKTNSRLYFISTFGFVFDSIPIAPLLIKELTLNKTSAFDIYSRLVTKECLEELKGIKEQIRENKFDLKKLSGKETYFQYSSLMNASSSFEKLVLLDNIEKQVWQNHHLLNLVLTGKKDSSFISKKSGWNSFKPCQILLHGQKQVDSVEFTPCNRYSKLARAVLKPNTASIYLFNQREQIVDSFTVNEEKLKDITADKHDVFALYRMWLEWQMENAGEQIKSMVAIKGVKFDPRNLSEGQLNRLDTLIQVAMHIEQKILYATLPDKDLLLISLLEQSKKMPRKNWIAELQQWKEIPVPQEFAGVVNTFTRGSKEYFLTDHRGNVVATVSDRKLQVDSNNDGIVDYYVADVVTATDYAPFGAQLPGRTYRSNGLQLRYGYNGKENDNEVKGEGNQQDYGFRISDPRLGRFLSVDPLTKDYPWYTPYQFAGNTPIWATDVDGAEPKIALPRGFTIPEPILAFPKAPSIPIPTQPLPPIPPAIPSGFSMPQSPTIPNVPSIPNAPAAPLLDRNISFDESTINPNDATTYPTPPASLPGDWKVTPLKPGTKGYNKLKDKGATRLENEKGDVLRWHPADKYHPKGHWDFKKGGSDNNPWENYTPDGLNIPDGQIYGKDFNPALIMRTDFNPFKIEVPAFLWDKYMEYKTKMIEYSQKKEEYDKKKKEYERELKQYQEKMEKYKKKLEKYIKDNPDALV